MTKEQKLEACSMRFDGASLQEIADHFGVTKEYISKVTPKAPLRSIRRAMCETYIYPNISKWMRENRIDAGKFSSMLHVSRMTVSNNFRGKTMPTKKTIDAVLEVTGMKYEEAFYTGPVDGQNTGEEAAI